MGNPHTCIPVTATVTVVAAAAGGGGIQVDDGDDTAARTAPISRHVDLEGTVGVLRLAEDLLYTGHGTAETHGTVWDCGLILGAFLGSEKGGILLSQAVAKCKGTMVVLRQDFALEDAIGSHACSLEALTCL
jgi:hypothetical protein